MRAAHRAYRKAACQGLSVGHQVGAHAEVLLRPAHRQAEPDKHLVEDQHDAALRAHFAKLPQPLGVGGAVEAGLAAAGDQRPVARCACVRVQRLQGVHQHARDVAALPQHAQRVLVHLAQRVGVARRHRVAHARLHVAPPAVVGPAEAHEVRAARVVAGETHRLHHGLGARHVERHLLVAGDLLQPAHVVGNRWVIGAQHGAQVGGARAALRHALLVEVDPEHVHPIGSGQVVELVPVEVLHADAGRRADKRARIEAAAHEAAVLERHPVVGGELQVGQAGSRTGGDTRGLREPLPVQVRKARKPRVAQRSHFGGRAVGIEKAHAVVLVVRHLGGCQPAHARVAGKRPVLGPGQLEALAEFGKEEGQRGRPSGNNRKSGFHA